LKWALIVASTINFLANAYLLLVLYRLHRLLTSWAWSFIFAGFVMGFLLVGINLGMAIATEFYAVEGLRPMIRAVNSLLLLAMSAWFIAGFLVLQNNLADVFRSLNSVERIAQEKSAQVKRRFFALAAVLTEAIITIDSLGRVDYWNESAETMFGRSLVEMQGHNLHSIMPERYRAAHDAALARLRAGGNFRFTGRLLHLEGLRRDGTEFPIALSVAPFIDAEAGNSQTFYVAVIREEKK
jgi:PAS domain S-box-containing protein